MAGNHVPEENCQSALFRRKLPVGRRTALPAADH